MRLKAFSLTATIACAVTLPVLGAETHRLPLAPGKLPFDEIAKLASSKRDQYETTASFDKQRCDALAKLLNADLKNQIVFQVLEGARSWYDANRSQYVFESTLKAGFPALKGFYVTLSSREADKPGFVAQNAYGVTRQVTVREGEYVALFIPASHLTKAITAILPMKPEDARALAGDLRLEIAVRLVAPCVSYNLNREDPTLSSPTKEVKKVYELHTQPGTTAWRIVRVSTGDVLKTGKP